MSRVAGDGPAADPVSFSARTTTRLAFVARSRPSSPGGVERLDADEVATIAIAKWEGAFDCDKAETAYRDRAAIAAADVVPPETQPGRDQPLPAALAS